MLEPIMDLTPELSLPLTDFQAPISSPTIYSSASDGSLHFQNEGVGGWRMAVTGMVVAFEDLELDGMIEQNAYLIQNMQGHSGDNTNQVTGVDEHVGQPVERATDDRALQKSTYKRAALLELQIATEDEGEEGNNANDQGDANIEGTKTGSVNKGKLPMMIVEGGLMTWEKRSRGL